MPTLQIHLLWLIEIELIFPIITPETGPFSSAFSLNVRNFPDVIFAVIEGLFPSSLRPPETSGASGSSFLESRSSCIGQFSSVIQKFLICNHISSCYFIHTDCQFINMEKSITCFLLRNRTIYSRT